MGPRFNILLVGVVILAVVIGVIAGQSQPRTTAAPAPTSTPTPLPTPQANHVNIVDSPSGTAMYLPVTLVVRVGQPVTWVNAASEDHSVLADSGTFNSDVLSPGQTFRWTPKTVGRYAYSDFLHPDMHGTLIVRP